VARLIETGVSPSRILAITFTNKAAREMAGRVELLLPGVRVWVSTFHRLCAQLLRRYGRAVGLGPNFTILDTADQAQVMRDVLTQLDIDARHYTPGKILHRIGQAKQKLQSAEEFEREAAEGAGSFFDRIVSGAYRRYAQVLLEANSVDFDDLLMHVARMLSDCEEIRAELDARFQHVLVDEYQDTNFAQYQIVKLLSVNHRNVCATGDPDQSIYGWRGAEIANILRFEHDFPDARVVRLEENYRSVDSILRAADRLIAHNQRRKQKLLVGTRGPGEPVELWLFNDQQAEAKGIASQIARMASEQQRPWSDFAVFFRVNALSRALELALVHARIPYQVAAGAAFYERTEVKDLLSYLRLIHNPADRAAFRRVVNTPARGIGKTSVDKLLGWAEREKLSPLEAARRAGQFPGIPKRGAQALAAFAALIEKAAGQQAAGVAAMIEWVLGTTGYGLEWRTSAAELDMQRVANIDELKSAAAQFDAEAGGRGALEAFLESASLVADADVVDAAAGKVTLMTLHAAKGLEFPVVFIMGVEEGILPHDRSLRDSDQNQLEEERRLMFVGVTRAEERLFLTRTWMRDYRGSMQLSAPSRFLYEMPHVQRSVPELPFAAYLPDASGHAEVGDDDGLANGDGRATAEGRAPARSGKPGQPTSQPEGGSAAEAQFAVGTAVRHPSLGEGVIVEARGAGKSLRVTVDFAHEGVRQFVASKSPLVPMGR
jgi:DNA helicase-2/ATP-dependent DNA helicase PcrA